MATLVGVVSQVIGEVFAVAGDGTRRPLSEGDQVFAGEQLITSAGGAIAITLSNGRQLTLGRDSSLNLTEQMLAADSDQPAFNQPAATAPPSDADLTDVEQLQAAIEAGIDPTLEGEATAAGPGVGATGGTGGAGGGNSFVLLSETGGALDPVIGFPTEGLSVTPEFPDAEPQDTAEPLAVVPPFNGFPQAFDDSNSISEDAVEAIAGNVLLNDDPGPDLPLSFLSWNTTAAEYGTFTDTGNGTYTYSLNNDDPRIQALDDGESLTETFTYTIADVNGDESSATLTISIQGTNDVPVITVTGDPQADGSDGIVYESGLPAGSQVSPNSLVTLGNFSLSDADGLDDLVSVTINSGSPILMANLNGATVIGVHGTLKITAYDASTGQGTYSYTLAAATTDVAGVAETDIFSLIVSDGNTNSAPALITIEIIDDVPVANSDVGNLVGDDATLNVAATSGVLVNDVQGADSAVVVGVTKGATNANLDNAATLGTTLNGEHGKLTLRADGSYDYVRNAGTPGGVQDVFTYTIKDGDGDLSHTTLTINRGDSTPTVIIPQAGGDTTTVYEAGLPTRPGEPAGSYAAADSETTSGTISFISKDGLQSVSLGGQLLTSADVVIVNDATGELTARYEHDAVTGAGTIHYSYTLKDNTSGDNTSVNFAVVVTDLDGDASSLPANLVINIIDDEPKANDDAPVCIIQSPLPLVNVTLVLDTSGSMAGTKIAALKAAVANLAQAYAALDAPIHVNLVTFATNSVNVGDYNFNSVDDSGYINLLNAVNSLSANGWTNYADALSTAKAQILLDVSDGANSAQQHKLYFISDGNPEPGPGSQVPAINAWKGFIENGNIDDDGDPATNAFQAYAIGINVNTGEYLNPIASSGAYILATPENLSATLLDLVGAGGAVVGNVLDNDLLGADGVGQIESVAVGAQTFTLNSGGTGIVEEGAGHVTYSFNAATKVLTLNTELGTLKIDLQGPGVGEYSFVAKANLSPTIFGDDGVVKQLFTYTLVDGDGDKSPANLEICIRSDQSVLVVGTNVNDDANSADAHFISSPFDTVPGGVIQGVGGNDVLIGDVGGSTPSEKSLNLLLMLDTSGSMSSNNRMAELKSSVNALLTALGASLAQAVRVHIVDFETNAVSRGTFDIKAGAGLDDAKDAIDKLTTGGWTNYEAALQQGLAWATSGSPLNGMNVINQAIFISDGDPTAYVNMNGANITNTAPITAMNELLGLSDSVNDVTALANAGFLIKAIGVGNGPTLANLNLVDSGAGDATIVPDGGLAKVLADLNPLYAPNTVGKDLINGGDGNDIIFGDSIYANSNDGGWAAFVAANPGLTNSELSALIAADHANYGQEGSVGGDDILIGGAGDDILYGQGGNDTLYGGTCNDRLIGGTGDDILWGGAGNDTFVWTSADRGGNYHDTVMDFGNGNDKLDLQALLDGFSVVPNDQAATAAALANYLTGTFNGADTVISIASGGGVSDSSNIDQTITLVNVNLGSNAGDIISTLLANDQLVA